MVLTVSAYKGGVGKTTASFHLAGVLGEREPILLLDRERVHGALKWYRKRDDWTFQTVAATDVDPELVRRYRRDGSVVIDTPAAPSPEEFAAIPPWPSRAVARTRAALERASVSMFHTEIPRAAAFTHAARQGRLVRDVRDRRAASLWSAYQELVSEIDHDRRKT